MRIKKIGIWVVIGLVCIPLALTILLSLFSYYRYPQIFPTNFTLKYWNNFLYMNPLMLESVKNSILIGSMNAISSTIIGFMTARALLKLNIAEHNKALVMYTIPLLMPATALFIGVHLMMIKLSLANTYIGVILVHMIISIPYATNIAISFLKGIPLGIEEIARTLGCSRFNLFRKVLLPLMMPGILFSTAICFVLSVSEYFAAFLVGGGKIITLSTLFYPYIHNADYGNGSVVAIIFIAINMSVFFVVDYIAQKLSIKNGYLFE